VVSHEKGLDKLFCGVRRNSPGINPVLSADPGRLLMFVQCHEEITDAPTDFPIPPALIMDACIVLVRGRIKNIEG